MKTCELVSHTDIWLMRTYWDLDFPRPFVPNFKYVGGIHCRPAKPLPKVGLPAHHTHLFMHDPIILGNWTEHSIKTQRKNMCSVISNGIVLDCLQDIEEFVQSSGDTGIVIFTLGSMVKNMTKEKENIIASALAQIPQKVRAPSLSNICNALSPSYAITACVSR